MDPRRALPIMVVTALLAVLGTVALVAARPGSTPAEAGPRPAPTAVAVRSAGLEGPRAVLADWDARRARAWAAGDVAGLRRLYVEGSRAGRADGRMLASYVERGLTVRGLRTQMLALDVLDSSADRLELLVTDRVAGARAVDGGTVLALPVDRPSTRRVTIARVDGVWLVDRVREAGPG